MIINHRVRNIEVCQENAGIVKANGYTNSLGEEVGFDHSLEDHQRVLVYSPDGLKELVERFGNSGSAVSTKSIEVRDEDSFARSTDCVLNFANSRHPGGGYLSGASAQEEALCRQSTLYASISSEEARQMYDSNRDVEDFDTDYLLLSPCVEVFRNKSLNFLEHPHTTAVISAAAPNLYGRARDVSLSELQEYYRHRIRQILCVAAENGYRTITLGAWGCGAFGNDPAEVAGAFKDILVDEGFAECFDRVIFAIPEGKDGNLQVFRDVYGI
ncbi:TIGR02452 family protein [Lachnospiraceae bacterium YH-ros2226]